MSFWDLASDLKVDTSIPFYTFALYYHSQETMSTSNIHDAIYTEELSHHFSLYCFHVESTLCCFAKFTNTMTNIAQFVCGLVETPAHALYQENVDQGWQFSKTNKIKLSSIQISYFCLQFAVLCVWGRGGQYAWFFFGQTSFDKSIQRN